VSVPDGWRGRVGLVAGLAGFALVAFAPVDMGLSAPARRTLAVAVLMATWWVSEALPLAATALVPIALFPLLGVLGAGEVTREYGHHLILLFLAGFLLAGGLGRWELDRRLALTVVSWMGDRPRRIVLGLMLVTAFLSMWVSNSATAAMMMPVGLALVAHAAEQIGPAAAGGPGRFRFGTAVMLGIAYAASIGGVATLIGTPPNVLLASLLSEQAGIEVGFARWMLVGVPTAALALPLVWLWLVGFAYRPEVERLPGGRQLVRARLAELGPLGRPGRRTLLVTTMTAAAWITLPLWEGLVTRPGLLTDASVGIAGAVALFLLPAGDGTGRRLLERDVWPQIPWNVLLLFGGGLALARAFEASGLAEALGAGLIALVDVPLALFVVVLVAVVVFLTEFSSNTATTAMSLPLLAAAAAASGIPASVLMVPAALAASMAFMMPAGTPPNAIVFGTGYVRIPEMVRAGVVANLLAIAVITLVTLVLVPRVL
jgi:sodium-dependent dicarboxylate transporter 2/3/5